MAATSRRRGVREEASTLAFEKANGWCLWKTWRSGQLFQSYLDQGGLDAFRLTCRRAHRQVLSASIFSCRQLLKDLHLYRLDQATELNSSKKSCCSEGNRRVGSAKRKGMISKGFDGKQLRLHAFFVSSRIGPAVRADTNDCKAL